MDNELRLKLAAAAAHGFIQAAAFDPIHDEHAKHIINEIAEILWPGAAEYQWKERNHVEG